ncbi:N-6 DNA methylase [Neisseria gonorrhoeae]|uniref:HsdM family class I SAM-dependent methyltransferase n=3 Tax=Neisseria gonorrhoeae TaxID=485 RepID=UPI0009E26A58|nr:class I SAM-dependent DNA methyltransferase [Neisseria gonorrhoeae]AZG18046.1 SAM-dependent DNA methyltransferase [Neisseria gonorrhoeae]AZG24951.1 SAM-dependent DNA methyltransferase [Neisseria gonorrhoeae]AZG41808.1 SAM-dependent DNA methyltransferase [Neisseria gonorrhoeae]ROU91404.1 SAM-dependent DNA methyltransferase [Neisseria gonorrhoeae]
MTEQHFTEQIKSLIDSLKTICANYGLGNDGNEFKIISQAFLYKFLNDKYDFEVKKIRKEKPDEPIEFVNMDIDGKTAVLKPEHSIKYLSERQNGADFAKLFDDTLTDIAAHNAELFSVKTEGGAKIVLFERISQYITDEGRRDDFCRALISKLAGFSFEAIFAQKFDFFATIFEYLIKDYNSNSGGKYAEYYTPHAVARIMADILVPEDVRGQIRSVDVYDPSAGSGTLLMNVAHAIGEDKCMIYTQDISQKSSNLLRLNLILNNLVHSLNNVVQGNTILSPAHKDASGCLKKFDFIVSNPPFKFDFIVSNPPFKLDFSDFRDRLESDENHERFFAGIPKIKPTKKEKMEIYQLFIQHILFSLKENGKAAIVLPTGFITAKSGIDKKIREYLVENKMLAGVVSMPSNIFATTGTNVSILFIDKTNKDKVVLIDASGLGEKIKDGKNQKTVLSCEEEQKICNTFTNKQAVEDFSVVVGYDEIKAKNHSLSAGQYFEVKIDYVDISADEFAQKIAGFSADLDKLFAESAELEKEIKDRLAMLKFNS